MPRNFISKDQGYIFWPAENYFPVFVDFLRSFKLHKGILTWVLSLFSFSSFPPFPLLFSWSPPSNYSLFFNLDKNCPPPPPGGDGQNICPGEKKQSYDKTLKELEKSKETKLYTAPHRGKAYAVNSKLSKITIFKINSRCW